MYVAIAMHGLADIFVSQAHSKFTALPALSPFYGLEQLYNPYYQKVKLGASTSTQANSSCRFDAPITGG